ncbi:MAG: hypothetical protein HY951_10670 [Bacteroidia bacterium]|nr:hypothetical protein [Bacteroidia bacterium]
MKNILKTFSIIAIVAIINLGFSNIIKANTEDPPIGTENPPPPPPPPIKPPTQLTF